MLSLFSRAVALFSRIPEKFPCLREGSSCPLLGGVAAFIEKITRKLPPFAIFRDPAASGFNEPTLPPVDLTEMAQRPHIGCNYNNQPTWKLLLGVPLIYLPIIMTLPFLIPTIFAVKTHLSLVGGMNIKGYWDFVPDWATHRYNYNTQIVLRDTRSPIVAAVCKTKLFWLFNCKLYCPLSVATFSYLAYLVKIVENWWCPFNHGKKHTYGDGAIDSSFWHVATERDLLHPDDLKNPIFS